MTDPNHLAFPVFDSKGDVTSSDAAGLIKREYFTAMAMQGLLAGNYSYYNGNDNVPVPYMIADDAIKVADLTIKALNETT
jgi:hypothetical protein